MRRAPTIQSAAAFRAEREADWEAFEELLNRVEKRGPRRLTEDELLQLPRLYRATLSSLSLARAISLDQALIAHSWKAYLRPVMARLDLVAHGEVKAEARNANRMRILVDAKQIIRQQAP